MPETLPWYSKSYRRNLVDMHIDDWDERFLADLDAGRYADLLAMGHIKSAMLYANSHVGLNYWPSSVGRMHRGLRGRDYFGEITRACRERGMDVVGYYSSVFNNWAYEQRPSWRMLRLDGKASRELREGMFLGGRYGLVCPNNEEYREFERVQVSELVRGYDLDGLFIDMNWWPMICHCQACAKRFESEAGESLPTVIDWSSAAWRRFQQKRTDWLVDHARFLEKTVKDLNPALTIEQNFAALFGPWGGAFSDEMAGTVDFTGGDFYGEQSEKDFVCKILRSLSAAQPFEFMTSRCYPMLSDHASTKSLDMLRSENALALAHGGAFFIIDAIDPDGTMDEAFYRTIGAVFTETEPIEGDMGGTPIADVAVYCSLNSFIDPAMSDGPAIIPDVFSVTRPHHLSSAVAAARALRERHIPFHVISKRNLPSIADYSVIVLPDILELDTDEANALRTYVAAGGSLYLSSREQIPLAAELLGFEYVGPSSETTTYLMPRAARGQHLSLFETQQLVRLLGEETQVDADIALPYTNPADPDHFTSIHSNPPAGATDYPAVLLGHYGKGRLAWAAAPFESVAAEYERHGDYFADIVSRLGPGQPLVHLDAPPYVEVLLHEAAGGSGRIYANFLNLQGGRSILPVREIRVSVRIPGGAVRAVTTLPEQVTLPFDVTGNYVTFELPELDVLRTVAIDLH